LETAKVRLDGAVSADVAVGVPVHCRGIGLGGLKGSLPTQAIKWFYGCVIKIALSDHCFGSEQNDKEEFS